MIRRAISIVEAVISVAIVGGLAIAVVNTVGSIGHARASAGERATAQILAADLLAEALSRRYCEDLTAKVVTLGPDAGETAPGNRSLFDDVDDYQNLIDPSVSGGVPRTREGLEVPGAAKGWLRRVTVERVSPADLSASLTDQGLVRVTVTVERDGRVLATRSGMAARLAEESPR